MGAAIPLISLYAFTAWRETLPSPYGEKTVLKVPRQCPIVLLGKVGWKMVKLWEVKKAVRG
jgi:hypothetical protein